MSDTLLENSVLSFEDLMADLDEMKEKPCEARRGCSRTVAWIGIVQCSCKQTVHVCDPCHDVSVKWETEVGAEHVVCERCGVSGVTVEWRKI